MYVPTRVAPRVPLFVCLFLLIASALPIVAQSPAAPGGFVEWAAATAVRARRAWHALLPVRGRFTFPAPYGTTGVRLTTAADCGGGDCVAPAGYSYWRNMNNHVGSDTILVALALDRRAGGSGPTLFTYNKVTGDTRNAGPLFSASSALGWASGEGWYFSARMPSALYVNDGARMLRYDVLTRAFTTVVDITGYAGAGRSVWQMHSSSDDRVHSFTVQDSRTYKALGCAVFVEPTRQYQFFAAVGEYDECQIDRSGRFLVIKENRDGKQGFDNVIVDLERGASYILPDPGGALGHSDLGFGYGVGEDDWNSAPGAVRVWRFDGGPRGGQVVFQATDWAFGTNHISHTNARQDLPVEKQIACSANANRKALARANEVICFPLDGSRRTLVVAPVMTDLDARGGGTEDYLKQPKGNLDVTGEYFLWTSNAGGARLDAFLVRVPLAQLGASPAAPAPSNTPPSAAPAAPVPPRDTTAPTVSLGTLAGVVSGTVTLSASATDNTGVGGVWFTVDGVTVTAEDTSAPYAATWNTRSVANGSHTIRAVARDRAGNASISTARVVTVSNPAAAPACLTIKPVANWVCVSGGWVPPDSPIAIAARGIVSPAAPAPAPSPVPVPTPQPAPSPRPQPAPAACLTIKPVANWVCVSGGWVPPDSPIAIAARGAVAAPAPAPKPQPAPTPKPPPAPAAPTACRTIKPVSNWVCVGGGWIPPDHPAAR